ncbi:MAG: hypothetical protein V3S25_10435 [Nitrospirales bacterium]
MVVAEEVPDAQQLHFDVSTENLLRKRVEDLLGHVGPQVFDVGGTGGIIAAREFNGACQELKDVLERFLHADRRPGEKGLYTVFGLALECRP